MLHNNNSKESTERNPIQSSKFTSDNQLPQEALNEVDESLTFREKEKNNHENEEVKLLPNDENKDFIENNKNYGMNKVNIQHCKVNTSISLFLKKFIERYWLLYLV